MRNALCARALTFAAVSCLLVSGSASVARAADRDFKVIVNHIKHQYNTSPKRMFTLGLASLFVKIARPAGVKSVKLAVFEDIGATPTPEDGEALDAALREGLEPSWKSMVRVSSRRDGELTRIFTRAAGKDFELLIVSIDRNDATVLKAKVSPESLAQWVSEHDVLDQPWNPMGNDAGNGER